MVIAMVRAGDGFLLYEGRAALQECGENRHLYRRKLLRIEIQIAAMLAFLDRIIGEMYNN